MARLSARAIEPVGPPLPRSSVPAATPWRAVTSDHPRRHVVYWNRSLGDGRRLAVGRRYGDVTRGRDGLPYRRFLPGRWRWALYVECTLARPGGRLIDEGPCSRPVDGKRLAEAAAELLR